MVAPGPPSFFADGMIALPPPTAARNGVPSIGWRLAAAGGQSVYRGGGPDRVAPHRPVRQQPRRGRPRTAETTTPADARPEDRRRRQSRHRGTRLRAEPPPRPPRTRRRRTHPAAPGRLWVPN